MKHDSRPLNVLFVITSMPVGGAETLLANLVRTFDPARISPSICCLKSPGVLGEQLACEFPVYDRLIGGKWDVGVLLRLIRLIRMERIDAVVTVGAGDKMFWGRLAARLSGVPVILSALHSTGWPDGVGRLNRMLTPITTGFIAVAENHRQHLRDVERFPANRVFLIPNGIDTDRFQYSETSRLHWRNRLGIRGDAPVVGIVAALRPEKNHGRFLHIASHLIPRIPDLQLLIVGDGPERKTIVSLAEELGLTDRVHLPGSIPDVPGILSAIDLFALTSDNEASPVSILEALSCERPVVAPDVGSIRETVVDGETGFVHPKECIEMAASLWERLLIDRSMAEKTGRQGRKLVCQTSSLSMMTGGYTDLIERLFESRTSGQTVQPARPAAS